MADFIGELSMQARDSSDLFYQQNIFAAMVSDALEAKLLDDTHYINGYDDTGEEVALVEDRPDLVMLPIELEEGNQEVKIIYRDAKQMTMQYEVVVYLLIEERE